ncbi:MAG: type I polyketide synthase [Desulfobacteraceae bacterium]|nr:type I polyketide synthase [Desulfobacteraceae bacterium]
MKRTTGNIAVTGIAGIFPGAHTIEKFTENIMTGHEAVMDVPDHRWIVPPATMVSDQYRPDTASSRRAGLVDDFPFDPHGFTLDRDLLSELDPLHKMVLHAGREALANCFHDQKIREKTGVILAAISLPTQASSEISHRIVTGDPRAITRADALSAGVVSVPAALLARAMGLSGGCFTLDAACASSLYAIKLACDRLNSGKADMMVAGGVSRPDSLYTQVGFTQLKALSPTGRCAPFDKSANGLVVGEGSGVLVLKRLDDAITCGDKIWGVIQGTGWSNDIEGNLVAPASEGQKRAMAAAFKNAGWLPKEIQHLECHGSATPVGDNIELNSMKTLWRETGCDQAPCAIGSVKSMTGHLLTAAGAAGMIKTLVAMDAKRLPPSLHYSEPTANSPLYTTGFRVQTEASPWDAKVRRAGVSAFGFGGINAHVLVEEFKPGNPKSYFQPGKAKEEPSTNIPIAIVGMETITATARNLTEFKEQVLGGKTPTPGLPGSRWRILPGTHPSLPAMEGLWINSVTTRPGEFHIPPNQIPDLLPQHLIMLKAATGALKDAEIPVRPAGDDEPRTRFGAAIGIEFDYEATDFHLRWRNNNADETVKDALAPPLTANRTLGALGGIVASRIAREFKLGGPCFTLSAEAASGMKAIETGIESLKSGETDTFLCGAVDMAGDCRQILLDACLKPFSGKAAPFDKTAKGAVPSEGAAAVVLKRLDLAQRNGNRIYGIIKGTGAACGGEMAHENTAQHPAMEKIYGDSLEQSLNNAGVSAPSIGLFEAHGSSDPVEDATELKALTRFDLSCALGSASATNGDTRSVSGLLSMVKASLALYHHIIPPVPGFVSPGIEIEPETRIHIPQKPGFWVRKKDDEPRRACVAAMTRDGAVSHLVLEEPAQNQDAPLSTRMEAERRNPLGSQQTTLIVVKADSREKLLAELEKLKALTGSMAGESAAAMGRAWFQKTLKQTGKSKTLSIMAASANSLANLVDGAVEAVTNDWECTIKGFEGIAYTLAPLGERGKTAFLYPGSGNHFPGMGRAMGALFPDILDAVEAKGASLDKQVQPALYYPQRLNWEAGWRNHAMAKIKSHAHNMIYGQVFFGNLMTRVAEKFNLRPRAGIGHSLGETASLFSLGVWNDPKEMLNRMEASDLFTGKLAGDFTAAAEVWNLAPGETPQWCVAAVNRSRAQVEAGLKNHDRLYLLIVNTPDETVIGGSRDQVEAFIKDTGCGAMFLDGVVTVHCPVAEPCREEYLALHRFECTPPRDIDFYSCSRAQRYIPETEATAQSILDQALTGFDYVKLINQAWDDGIRVFVDMGPGSSCTRAVRQILKDKEHLVLSLSEAGGNGHGVLVKGLATLAAHGLDLDLSPLYPPENAGTVEPDGHELILATGRSVIDQRLIAGNDEPEKNAKPLNNVAKKSPVQKPMAEDTKPKTQANRLFAEDTKLKTQANMPFAEDAKQKTPPQKTFAGGIKQETWPADQEPAGQLVDSARLTAHAHESFLSLTQENMKAYEQQFAALAQAAAGITAPPAPMPAQSPREPVPTQEPFPEPDNQVKPMFDKAMCLEFATGLAGNVLGDPFKIIDTYPVRVRLPDAPLMLVDRIMDIQGEMLSLGAGKIVTQHDVLPSAWYLDGDKAPVSITIEAGQADLFLCSWLGIDHMVKGKRRYRLLDAKVTFHRDLPRPGETIEYHIEIDRFLKQGDVYLFFFHYRGYINDELLISMRDGCAGFFTPEEVENSGGIILKPEDKEKATPKAPFTSPIPVTRESYSDARVDALRRGDLEAGFGDRFKGMRLGKHLRLPGGRMHLLDRVTSIDPTGGRFGLGTICAEADIRPDHWFLTCHFTDDMVMPGTLMYECCAHTLRIFTQRMGWVSERDDVRYDIIPGIESDLKCRGPVTVDTKKAGYEIEIKEMGYGPEPYVIADAHMFSDNHRIVLYKNMGIKIAELTRQEIERIWS